MLLFFSISFPRSKEIAKMWACHVARMPIIPKRSFQVCSDHFEPEDLIVQPDGTLKLSWGAVPVKCYVRPKRCAYTGCQNVSNRTHNAVLYFGCVLVYKRSVPRVFQPTFKRVFVSCRFPLDPKSLAEWNKVIDPVRSTSETPYICSAHFRPCDLKTSLVPFAIPISNAKPPSIGTTTTSHRCSICQTNEAAIDLQLPSDLAVEAHMIIAKHYELKVNICQQCLLVHHL